jgi:DNA-directed RNA polymerase subunit E'
VKKVYEIITLKDKVRVPPEKLGEPLEKAVKEALEQKFEGMINEDIGVGLAVESIKEISEGKILPGDGGVHYWVTFDLLSFKPFLHELVIGEVVDNAEFGAFVRIGPLDGLVHISQIMDDYVAYDSKNSVFTGRKTRKTLKEGDVVLARVISISWKEQNKIGLTMRQAGLGALHWLQKKTKGGKK